MIDTHMMIFLKDVFQKDDFDKIQKDDFDKKSADDKTKHAKLPSRQRVKTMYWLIR